MTNTSTEQPELLPCPFCGGDVKHEIEIFHKVECQDCGLDAGYFSSYAKLAAFWNRRTPAARQMPEPEATVHSKIGTTCMFPSSNMRKGDKIYTEYQVRQLLAKHGIK